MNVLQCTGSCLEYRNGVEYRAAAYEPDVGKQDSKRPKNRRDCTVVALAVSCGVDYDTAYDELAQRGRKSSTGFWFPSSVKSRRNDTVLGVTFTWYPLQAVKGERRMTPTVFVHEHPSGKFVLRLSKHVVAVIDGVVYDPAGRLDACVYGYWAAS